MTSAIHMTGTLDPRSDWTADHCPMAAALDVVRTRSAFLVLREAFYGATRFEEFAQRTGLSEPIASARLRELVKDGILRREPYQEPGQRTRRCYRLTAKGEDLLPVLAALMQWGDKWLVAPRARVELRHRGCGAPMAAALRCAAGHPVAGDEIDLVARRTGAPA